MKPVIRYIFFALLFISSIKYIHAKPSNKVSFLPQTKDTLQVNQDSLVVIVYVSFIVDKKGKVGNVKIFKTESDSCSVKVLEDCKAEALRTVRTMPKWAPAFENGKPVAIPYTLPVRFTIPREEPEIKKEN